MNERKSNEPAESTTPVRKRLDKLRHRFADVRWSRLRYMLIFTHAPLFANMSGSFFAFDPKLMGIDAESWMRIAYCLGAGFLFLFATPRNMRSYAKLLAISAAALFAGWIVVTDGVAGVFLSSGFAFCYGGCGGIAAFHFAYMLNNSERFVGAALTSLFYTIFQLDFALGLLSSVFNRVYMSGLVLVTLICMLRYRAEDYASLGLHSKAGSGAQASETGTGPETADAAAGFSAQESPEEHRDRSPYRGRDRKNDRKLIALTFYFFFAYHIVEMFYTYMQGESTPLLVLVSGAAGALVIIISLWLYFSSQFNLWHMCHLFFLTMFASYVLLFAGGSNFSIVISRAFHGGEQIGFIASYCMLWGTLQARVGFRAFKTILVCTLNIFFAVYVMLGRWIAVNPGNLPLVSCLITLFFFMVFLMLSPAYANVVFQRSKEAAKEPVQSNQPSETHFVSREKRMDSYSMTSRERQVCGLLLDGFTSKQIAADLDISIDTVKFHTKNIYKKVGAGGKSGLFAAFNPYAPEETAPATASEPENAQ